VVFPEGAAVVEGTLEVLELIITPLETVASKDSAALLAKDELLTSNTEGELTAVMERLRIGAVGRITVLAAGTLDTDATLAVAGAEFGAEVQTTAKRVSAEAMDKISVDVEQVYDGPGQLFEGTEAGGNANPDSTNPTGAHVIQYTQVLLRVFADSDQQVV